MSTKIIRCNCDHPYQDEMYGKGNRLANVMRTGQAKCTICNTVSGSVQVITKNPHAKAEKS